MQESFNKKAISSLKYTSGLTILIYIIKFVKTPVFARILSPEDFGLLGLANVIVIGLQSLSQLGTRKLIIQRPNTDQSFISTAWGFLILRGILITAICLSLAPFYSYFVENEKTTSVLLIIAFIPLLNSFISPTKTINERNIDFKKVTYFEGVIEIYSLIITFIFVLIYKNVYALAWGLVLTELGKAFASHFVFKTIRLPNFRLKPYLKEFISVGKYYLIIGIGTYITIQLDNLVVGKYLGSKELGYYMIAYSLINLFINTFKKIISRVLFPFYSRKINHDKKYIAKIEPLIKVQIISILVIVFTAFFLAEPMIKLIYGNKWISSIPIFTMLLMACTFRLISHILVPLFRAINELKPPAISKILEIILFFPITYFLTKQFDASGTALAMGLIFLISTSYRAYSISKILQFSFINIRTGTSIILFVSTLVLYFINLEYNIGNYMIYGTASLGLLLSLFILYKEKATIYALYYNK